MNRRIVRFVTIAMVGVGAGLLAGSALAEEPALPASMKNDELVKRTSKMEMYPCTECHDSLESYNARPRKLEEEHDTITAIHPEQLVQEDPKYWCQNCHQFKNYNRLHLEDGEVITFNESYRLCAQCHGPVFDDWKKNLHGQRTRFLE